MQPNSLILVVQESEVDVATAPAMAQALRDGMDAAGIFDVVVDLDHVRFMDSTGLGALIETRNYVVSHDGSIGLTRVHRQPLKAMRLTGLADLLPLVTLPSASDGLLSD